MRFCIVTPFFPSNDKSSGCVGTHYFDLTVTLAPKCEKILLLHVSSEPIEKTIKQLLPNNVEVFELNTRLSDKKGNPFSLITKIKSRINKLMLNIRVASKINELDRQEGLDVIETTNYYYLCLVYSFLPYRKPLITRISSTTGQLREYGNWNHSRLDLIEKLELWMFKRSSLRVTHTVNHGNLVAAITGIPSKEIIIIPHGTLIREHRDPTAERQKNSETTILFLGRLEARKGIHTLLDAIPTLIGKHEALRFRIAGEDDSNFFKAKFLQHHPEFEHKVQFLGEISDKQKALEYAACDIFVAPSLYESFGLIYVEAMSFSKPVIGCRSGGTPEVVRDGEDGFLITPDSVSELVNSIDDLVKDPVKREQMGNSGKLHVLKNFTAEIMASNSIRVLNAIKNDWSKSY
jgi:glycosyltransferase involved in cell wall biosynthesis